MLEGSPRVLVVEGELAVLIGVSHYLVTEQEPWAVVGPPAWKNLQPEWCWELAEKEVVVLVEASKAAEVGRILGKFSKAKIPAPRAVEIPDGTRLIDFLRDTDLDA